MWARKKGASGGAYHAWLQRFSSGTVGYQLYVNNSDNVVRFYTNTVLASSYAMSDTNWHYLCITNSNDKTSFYVDGYPYGSGSQTLSDVPTSTVNNFGLFSSGGRINGQIADARIYNRALSANEIRTLAQRPGIAYELAPRKTYFIQAATSTSQFYDVLSPLIFAGTN